MSAPVEEIELSESYLSASSYNSGAVAFRMIFRGLISYCFNVKGLLLMIVSLINELIYYTIS